MSNFYYEASRSELLTTAQTLVSYNSPRSNVQSLVYLNELVHRLPSSNGDRIDPQLAHEISTAQRLLGQTAYGVFQTTDAPEQLDAALAAYHEAVRCVRCPDPDMLMEAIKIYRSHGAHEGCLHLCSYIIQENPMYRAMGEVVMIAIACMVQLNLEIPGQYVQWLCEMPTVEETAALLLTARATEQRGKHEEARNGYREIYLRLKTRQVRDHTKEEKNSWSGSVDGTEGGGAETKEKQEDNNEEESLIGEHSRWDVWCEDHVTWIKAGRFWFDRKEYEIANLMFGAALRCTAMPGDECLAKLSFGHARIGHHEKSFIYFKRMSRGKFQKKIIGTHRTFPKFARVSFRRRTPDDVHRNLLERCYFLNKFVRGEALKLDNQEREKDERKKMKRVENEIRLFLTEEKIWNACVTIGCYMRMWIAQAKLRKRRTSVIQIQSTMRIDIAKSRVSRIRALLRVSGMKHSVLVFLKISSWNARIRLQRITAVAMLARKITTKMCVRRINTIGFGIATGACAIRATIDGEILRRGRMKLSTVATLVHSHGRIRNIIQFEKERRAAIMLQRMFRNRLMKQLLMVLRGDMSSYPNMALSLWYRKKLTGMSKMILEKRLTPFAQKIENQYRRRKAHKLYKRKMKAKEQREQRRRQKELAETRRRIANQARKDKKERRRLAELRSRKRQIAKDLLGQLSNPNWETLSNLLREGEVALGVTNDLMVRGKRLIKALEKESAHQRYRKNSQKSLVSGRARARKFESVDQALDLEFVAGRLNIPNAPQSPPPNLVETLTGDDNSSEKKRMMPPMIQRMQKQSRARPEVWENVE